MGVKKARGLFEKRQSGEPGAPSEEGTTPSTAHGDAGSDLHGLPYFVPCTTVVSVFRASQSLGASTIYRRQNYVLLSPDGRADRIVLVKTGVVAQVVPTLKNP